MGEGPSSIRELLEAFPEDERLAYTTVQTVVYRLEAKKAIRRSSSIVSNAHVFEAVVTAHHSPTSHDRRSGGAVRRPTLADCHPPDRIGQADT